MRTQRATLVSAAMLLGVVIASDVFAGRGGGIPGRSGHGGGYSRHGHFAGGHSGSRFVAPHPARVFPRTVFVATPLAYAPITYYAPPPVYFAPPIVANAPLPVYYVPPITANAPLFSFNESTAEPEWNWQRVNLQQLVAEVRAKREAGRKP